MPSPDAGQDEEDEELELEDDEEEGVDEENILPSGKISPSAAAFLQAKQSPDHLPHGHPVIGLKPQSILKKKKHSLGTRTNTLPEQHPHFSIHPILKRNSVGTETASSFSAVVTPPAAGHQVHPILKKSSSEDRTWWTEESARGSDSSQRSASLTVTIAPAVPRPILKKRTSMDSGTSRSCSEIRPILKRKDSPKNSDTEFVPKPIIKSLSRNGSDESASSPPTSQSSGSIRPVDGLSDELRLHEESSSSFSGRMVQQQQQQQPSRRKSHPVSAEDLRLSTHYQNQTNDKQRSPPIHQPLHSDPSNDRTSSSSAAISHRSPYQQHFHQHQHHCSDGRPFRRSPPLLKSLPTSPSSGFEKFNGMGVNYAFVDEFDKKLCMASDITPLTDPDSDHQPDGD